MSKYKDWWKVSQKVDVRFFPIAVFAFVFLIVIFLIKGQIFGALFWAFFLAINVWVISRFKRDINNKS